MTAAHILVIDDEPDIRGLVRDVLEDEGYRVTPAADAAEARRLAARERPDAALLDIWMPGEDGIALLRAWSGSEGGLGFPVVMMSGHGTIETAVEATRLGAYDFIEKPITLAKLLITLQRALEASRLRRDNAALRRHAQPQELIGDSAVMRALRTQLERLAAHDAPVLLRGEPGTGKETLARWLHGKSSRRDAPFVAVAAAALAGGQTALTLFGAEDEGGVRPGLLEQAQGGALFLDEVGALDADSQLRLSSALERRQLLRLGGRAPVPLDIRVIAASAQDLEAARAAGRLRDEFYFQLNVVPLEAPPLRRRREDIAALTAYFAAFFSERDRLPPRTFSTAALERLMRHPWPGNVRELRNLVQRLLVLGQSGEVSAAEVDAALAGDVASLTRGASRGAIDYSLPLREARELFERDYLQHRLDEVGGSVGRLAKIVEMERTHLYRKLRDLGIEFKIAQRDGAEG